MRLTALGAGVLLSFVIISVNHGNVSAQTVQVASFKPTTQSADKLAVLTVVEEKATPEAPAAPPAPTRHVVADGENLSKIAAQHQTTWKRLFDKNTQVTDPDEVKPGQELVIPLADEQVVEREVPADPAPVVEVAPVRTSPAATAAPKAKVAPKPQAAVAVGNSAGNTYTPGQCTWYVKNRRGASLPNGLGNADQWFGRAQAMGMATGYTPRPGAAGVRPYGQHAVYVEAVHGDGTITISEMNYNYTPYSLRSRTANARDFLYIY